MSSAAKRVATGVLTLAVVVGIGRLIRANVPQVPTNTWAATGDMAQARGGASAALLPDGKVLVTGGIDENGAATATVERYSADGGSFLATPPMSTARANHSTTLLADGRVLVAGGAGADRHALASAEIYDPASNAWTTAAPMNVARRGHTATLLADGTALIAGGDDAGTPTASLELFDPASSTFTLLSASLASTRTLHATAALADGRVMIAGGFDGTNPLDTTDIFDPKTGAVAAGPAMSTPRSGLSLTGLLGGKVLAAGGAGQGGELSTAEVYDPTSNAWVATDNTLASARQNHLAFLLPHNNQVLIVGGVAGGTAVPSAEIYTPWEGTNGAFCSTAVCASGYAGPGLPIAARAWAAGSALSYPASDTIRSGPNDGLLLLAGGSGLKSAEVYGFATIRTDKADYAPGTTVTITGSGFVPGESVALVLREQPNLDTHPLLNVTADGSGNVVSTEFAPDDHDVNIRFYLTAFGGQSQAQTTFTDNANKSIFSDSANTTVTSDFGTIVANQCRNSFLVMLNGSNLGSLANAQSAILSSTPSGATFFAGPGCSGTPVSSITIPANTSAGAFSFSIATPGNYTIGGVGAWDNGNNHASAVVKVNKADQTISVTTSAPVSAAYGSTFSVAATASSNLAVAITALGGCTGSGSGSATVTMTSSTTSCVLHYNQAGDGSYNPAPEITSSTTASKATVTASVTASNKVYDGTTTANITNCTLTGVLAGDVGNVTCSAAGPNTFGDKNVGTGKTVTATNISLSGNAAGNYQLSAATATTTASISALAITVTAAANSKTYDGTTSAAAVPTIAPAVAAGDTPNFIETYDSRNVGSGETLTPSGSVNDGNSGNNYSATFVSAATGTIAARPITVTAATNSKEYDATTSAAATPTITSGSLAVGDTAGFSEVYDNKNVGSGKTLTPAGSANDGNSGNNYAVTFVNDTTGVITARAITVTAAANSKVYDGTTGAAATPTVTSGNLVGSDTGNFTEVYDNKDVGSGKTLTPSGSVSDGNGGNNYLITFVSSTNGTITARTLVVTASALNRPYDGTTAASVTLSDDRLAGDSLTVNYSSASFADKNAGIGKTVTVSGLSIAPTGDGANYTLNGVTQVTTTANITPVALTVTAVSDTKVYDATTTSTQTPGVTPAVIAGDTPNFTQAFDSKNAGSRTLTPSGSVNDGNGGNNYTVTFVPASGSIAPAPLSITAVANTKTYDGTTSAAGANPTVSGLKGTDTVSGATETYDTKNVGTNKTLSVTAYTVNDGNAGLNYSVTTFQNHAGVIQARALTVTATASNKVYDGTTTATVTLSDNRIAGDVFTDTYASANFSDRNVGAAKTVTVTGISIAGADAGNYTANTTATTTADISKAVLTITAVTNTKVWDGNTSAAAVPAVSGLIAPDSITGLAERYDTPDVGTGKLLTVVAGFVINDGNGGGNYAVTAVSTSTGVITSWKLTGFYSPVAPTPTNSIPVWNTIKGGSTVPLKFNIYLGDNGPAVTSTSAVVGESIQAFAVVCGGGDYVNTDLFADTGGTALRYDGTSGQFIQNWQTPKGAGKCYVAVMKTSDGSMLSAYFQTK